MKKIYNCSIDYIISIVLAFPMIALIVLKYALKVVDKVLKTIGTIVEVCKGFIITLREKLIEELSVED